VIPRVVVASKNADKLAEIEEVLGITGLVGEIVRGVDWEDVEETGVTLEENALLKARAAMEATGLPALADDTGLEVEALGGAPGVLTARFAGDGARYEDNVAKMVSVMAVETNRSARFRTVVALVFPDGSEIIADGAVEGVIADRPRGNRGFGYDPIFEVEGRTLAEMSAEEKNGLSHRARALRSLADAMGL